MTTTTQTSVVIDAELYKRFTTSLENSRATLEASMRQARRAYEGRPIPTGLYGLYRDPLIAIVRLQQLFAPDDTDTDKRIRAMLEEGYGDFLRRIGPPRKKKNADTLNAEQRCDLVDSIRETIRVSQDVIQVTEEFCAPEPPDGHFALFIDAVQTVLYALARISNRLNLAAI